MTTPYHSSDPDEESAMLRAVLETVVDAIITIDERGIVQNANSAVESLFGYSQQELIGNNISMLMPSPDREQHDSYITNFIKSGIPKIIGFGREVVALKKDGHEIPVDLSVTEVTFDHKRLFTGIIRDMSDRDRARKALVREREFNDSIIETAHAIVVLLGVQGDVERINPFFEELTGYQNKEVLGKNWFDTFIAEEERDQLRDLFRQSVKGTPVHGHVNAVLTRTGERRLMTWSGKRIVDEDQNVLGVLAIGNDITELNQAQQQLIQSERLAAIGQMVTGLAHESRNALQRAKASLEVLSLDLDDQPKLDMLINRAQRALEELQYLYEEVRNYAAPLKLKREDVNLLDLVESTWEHLVGQWRPLHLHLKIKTGKGKPIACIDRARIQQVIRNILENAIAVAEKESEITVEASAVQEGDRPRCTIQITDQGPGLDQEQLAKLFDPFFTTKTKGTGLGMAIAHRIIDAHQGTITARNTEDGAQITFSV